MQRARPGDGCAAYDVVPAGDAVDAEGPVRDAFHRGYWPVVAAAAKARGEGAEGAAGTGLASSAAEAAAVVVAGGAAGTCCRRSVPADGAVVDADQQESPCCPCCSCH